MNNFESSRFAVAYDTSGIYSTFFGTRNIQAMSKEITFRLQGIHPQGKNIIIHETQLRSVMDSVYKNTSRDIERMIMMTISYCVDAIKDEFITQQQNSKLTPWVQMFPESSGLRQYSKIKIRDKRPTPMMFIENY